MDLLAVLVLEAVLDQMVIPVFQGQRVLRASKVLWVLLDPGVHKEFRVRWEILANLVCKEILVLLVKRVAQV